MRLASLSALRRRPAYFYARRNRASTRSRTGRNALFGRGQRGRGWPIGRKPSIHAGLRLVEGLPEWRGQQRGQPGTAGTERRETLSSLSCVRSVHRAGSQVCRGLREGGGKTLGRPRPGPTGSPNFCARGFRGGGGSTAGRLQLATWVAPGRRPTWHAVAGTRAAPALHRGRSAAPWWNPAANRAPRKPAATRACRRLHTRAAVHLR